MRSVIVLETALQDVRDLIRYIAQHGEGLAIGEAFARKIRDRCERIAALPGTLGTARPDLGVDMRSTPHKGYVIFFRYPGDTAEIVNVLHGSRDVIAYYGDPE